MGLAASQDGPGGEAEQKREQQQPAGEDAEEQRRLQEAFLAAYLAQVQAAARSGQDDGDDEPGKFHENKLQESPMACGVAVSCCLLAGRDWRLMETARWASAFVVRMLFADFTVPLYPALLVAVVCSRKAGQAEHWRRCAGFQGGAGVG